MNAKAKNSNENVAAIKEKLRQTRKKAKKNKKRARIVVKNLPFSTTEENLKEYFGKFGNIEEITLLRKPDGSLVGCAFIQFELVTKAAKAIHYTNEKKFLDREIQVEWSMPKEKYKQTQQSLDKIKIKEEPLDDNFQIKTEDQFLEIKKEEPEVENDEELSSEIVGNSNAPESENDKKETGNELNKTFQEEENQITKSNKEKNSDSEIEEQESITDESEIEEEESITDESEVNISESVSTERGNENETINLKKDNEKKTKFVSNDASEGKTVFIKNVPFHVTNEDLGECMSQFGPFFYALICMDHLTEHSKGTAFVKFKSKEDAEKCLSKHDLKLFDNVLDCQPALTKNDLEKQVNNKLQKKATPTDSRNLYLVKEGVVLAGSKAAEGVSEADMAKRLQLEQYKTQMLRNLNMFVSRYRIVVHNIPLSWDDNKLRKLCSMHADPKAVMRETRIMKNLRNVDANGIGKSKGFGFVSFTTHEDALKVLRSLNNNPNVFSSSKRPIVTFSIENRSKIAAKEKRTLNSRLNNPNCKDYNKFVATKKKNKDKTLNQVQERKRKYNDDDDHRENYTGINSKPGDLGFKKMRSTLYLKKQAQLHHQTVKTSKKLKKKAKQTLAEKSEHFTKQPKQKMNIMKLNKFDNFSKLVNEYKKKLLTPTENTKITKKTKWFDASN